MAVGETVTPRLVSTTSVGNGATFTASGETVSLPADYAQADGTINYEAIIDDGVSEAHWNYPAAAAGNNGAFVTFNLATSRVDDGTPATQRISTKPLTAMVKAPGAAATSTAAGAVLPETVVPLGGGCVPVWGKTSASQVDEEYFTQANGSLYALATTHEEINSSHTLGIAYQQNGSQWSASGTANMTTASGGTVTTAASNGAHWYANHVTYREWTNTCPLVQHEWRPESPYSLLDRYQIVASPT